MTSQIVISVPHVAGEMLEAFNEFTNTDDEIPSFQQELTYRRHVFAQNPITGDLDTTTYTEYAIYGMLDVLTQDNPLVEAGEMNQGDSDIFLPSRIRRLADGTFISAEFRPQLGDYVIYKNVTYRIDDLSFNMMGQTETFTRAKGTRMQDLDTSPEEYTDVPFIAGEYLDAFKVFETDPSFSQNLTYRCFTVTNNPITGDIDQSTYTDYDIYGTLDILETEKDLKGAGELQIGDAIVHMSSRISKERDGTAVSPQIKPKVNDYIYFNNITYRVKTLDFPIMGSTETFAKLYCLKIEDDSVTANVTTVPYVPGEVLDLFYDYLTTPEFQQTLTYRNFTEANNPVTGDLDKTTYTDYTIYGTIDISNIKKDLGEAGEMRSSTAEIWLKARLNAEVDGTEIDPQIRPTINDYVIYSGVTYRISRIIFYLLGTNEMYAKVIALRLSSVNPTVDWNSSYNSTYTVGGGYS